MRPALLGLVADDLTGAGDSAAGFADAGWTAVLALRPWGLSRPTGPGPTVLALSTGARADADVEAAARTAQAVDALVEAGAERLYLKVDSTVRGSVAGQVAGALAAWSRHRPRTYAVVCPAFPTQQRAVVAGEVLVAGAPLARSAAALDPVTPRADGDLMRVLPGAVLHRGLDLTGPPGALLIADAAVDADLDRLARWVDDAGPDLVVVGSGGLAAALGRRWAAPALRGPVPAVPGRLLLAVSSLHPASADQLRRLRAASFPDVDVLTTGTGTVAPRAAAAELAERVAAALHSRPYEGLVLVGGDGAAAILARLGADGVRIDGAVVPGSPTGVIADGEAAGLRLVTRSGGFGAPDALHEIVRTLRATCAPTPEEAP